MNGVEKLIKGVKLKECPSNFGLKDCKHDKEESGHWCKYVLNENNEICEECWRLSLEQTYEE